MGKKITLTRDEILVAVNAELTMFKAAIRLGVTYTSFIRYAKFHNLYMPNMGGRGTKKPKIKGVIPLEEYLARRTRPKSSLKLKLYKAGLKKEECEDCGMGPIWNGKRLVLQLDHRDGDCTNNSLTNLAICCPNCHSQTSTFCSGQGKSNMNTLKLE